MAVAEDGHTPYFENTFVQLEGRVTRDPESFFKKSLADGEIARNHELRSSAGWKACGFWGLSSPQLVGSPKHGTGMSRKPADKNVCATGQFMESGIVSPKCGLIQ
jgi:hypothetical protein